MTRPRRVGVDLGDDQRVIHAGKGYTTVVLSVVTLFFILPLVASARFSFSEGGNGVTFAAYATLFKDPEFWSSFLLSLKIAVVSVVLALTLLVPTSIWLRWKAPRLNAVVETVSLMPLVIPTVVVTLGIMTALNFLPNVVVGSPLILSFEYVVLALPFTYRALDASVRALDVRTLAEAGHSLGAGTLRIIWWILLPNLKAGVVGVVVLQFAFCLGEFVVASLMGFTTFPVYLVQVGNTQASEAVAFSVVALLFTWLPLSLVTLSFSRTGLKRSGQVIPLFIGESAGVPREFQRIDTQQESIS